MRGSIPGALLGAALAAFAGTAAAVAPAVAAADAAPVAAARAAPAAAPLTAAWAARAAGIPAEPSDTPSVADAYLDPTARALVREARARREQVDASLAEYRTTVRDRASFGLQAGLRERLLYRCESALAVAWRRDGEVTIDVLGAREVAPPVSSRIRVPENLLGCWAQRNVDFSEGGVRHRVLETGAVHDPGDDRFLAGFGGMFASAVIRHPLGAGSEADYRFRTGDTTTVRLADGTELRLIELRFEPRRQHYRLLRGSLWLDADSHGVVRAAYRLARPYDVERDREREQDGRVPGLLSPIEADVHHVSVDYGLWDLRWWLPRTVVLEGSVRIGRGLRLPARYERVYGAYEVRGGEPGPPGGLAFAVDTTRVGPASDMATEPGDSLPREPEAERAAAEPAAAEPAEAAAADRTADRRQRRYGRMSTFARECSRRYPGRACLCAGDTCRPVEMRVPADSVLLASAHLPDAIWAEHEPLIPPAALARLRRQLPPRAGAPWRFEAPRFAIAPRAPGLVRYNRVEGLSVGARGEVEFGPLGVHGLVRLGFADLEPNGELGVTRRGIAADRTLSAYRRLAAAEPAGRPLGFGNSAMALLFGRDDGDYFRAAGIELVSTPAPGSIGLEWRLYVERQSAAEKETDFALFRRGGDGDVFRDNIRADPGTQVGAAARLRLARGLDPLGFRWAAGVRLQAEAGEFEFAKPAASVEIGFPAPGAVATLAAAAGTSAGDLPVQSLWYLGGPASLRGYDGGVLRGPAFWAARAELATRRPAARLALFGDAGWAGPRDELGSGRPLVSAGAGLSFLDGLFRFDLARALRSPTGWRADLHVSAWF